MLVFTLATALACDAFFGEPRRWHPLVGFGRLAEGVERGWYADSFFRGALAVSVLLLPFTLIAIAISRHAWSGVFDVILLYLALGGRSLVEHGRRVRDALAEGDVACGRQRVAMMVSRDTTELGSEGIAKAAVESILENGNDAVFGALFWFVVAGAPGVVLYRLANTLDAMWGYRNSRYQRFGWAAARLDDVLNFIPARLTALSYAIVGNTRVALHCWRTQGVRWKSPNAGPVMAAGAGSLGIQLGGSARYRGVVQSRPQLGEGRIANVSDIDKALTLIRNSTLLWLFTLILGASIGVYVA